MTRPSQILGDIRDTAFFDVFETRDGLMVCRPGRYNKVEVSLDEEHRANAETDVNGSPARGNYQPQTLFAYDATTSTWEFEAGALHDFLHQGRGGPGCA